MFYDLYRVFAEDENGAGIEPVAKNVTEKEAWNIVSENIPGTYVGFNVDDVMDQFTIEKKI